MIKSPDTVMYRGFLFDDISASYILTKPLGFNPPANCVEYARAGVLTDFLSV